jgi:hypothetical protein
MKKTLLFWFIFCLIFNSNQSLFAQGSPKFKEYLKKNPDLESSQKIIDESFQKDPELGTMTNDLVTWHKSLINKELDEPIKKLIEAWVNDPTNYTTSKEYAKAEKIFIQIVKDSFKKDDSFKKKLGSDDLTKWIFNAGAFLAGVQNSFTKYDQEQDKSYRVESIIILHYTAELMNIINDNTREEAQISESFKKYTASLIKWIGAIPADLRK